MASLSKDKYAQQFEEIVDKFRHRAPDTLHYVLLFRYDHLPLELQVISEPLWDVMVEMIDRIEDGTELWTGLRKLLEAKDCFVRARVIEITKHKGIRI